MRWVPRRSSASAAAPTDSEGPSAPVSEEHDVDGTEMVGCCDGLSSGGSSSVALQASDDEDESGPPDVAGWTRRVWHNPGAAARNMHTWCVNAGRRWHKGRLSVLLGAPFIIGSRSRRIRGTHTPPHAVQGQQGSDHAASHGACGQIELDTCDVGSIEHGDGKRRPGSGEGEWPLQFRQQALPPQSPSRSQTAVYGHLRTAPVLVESARAILCRLPFFSYRRGFAPIRCVRPVSGEEGHKHGVAPGGDGRVVDYVDDNGWGCMPRCAQMLLAVVLLMRLKSRGTFVL